MFIRFVVGMDGEDHRQLTGVFIEADLLLETGALSVAEAEFLEETFRWFDEHLPVPPFRSSNWPRDAVAWFKHDAACLDQIWRLVALLREHGANVRLMRSRNPGKILSQDRHQVVVHEPRSDRASDGDRAGASDEKQPRVRPRQPLGFRENPARAGGRAVMEP